MKTEFKVSIELVEAGEKAHYESVIILPKGDGRLEDLVWKVNSADFEKDHKQVRRATLEYVCKTVSRAIIFKIFPDDSWKWEMGASGTPVCKGYPTLSPHP